MTWVGSNEVVLEEDYGWRTHPGTTKHYETLRIFTTVSIGLVSFFFNKRKPIFSKSRKKKCTVGIIRWFYFHPRFLRPVIHFWSVAMNIEDQVEQWNRLRDIAKLRNKNKWAVIVKWVWWKFQVKEFRVCPVCEALHEVKEERV